MTGCKFSYFNRVIFLLIAQRETQQRRCRSVRSSVLFFINFTISSIKSYYVISKQVYPLILRLAERRTKTMGNVHQSSYDSNKITRLIWNVEAQVLKIKLITKSLNYQYIMKKYIVKKN